MNRVIINDNGEQRLVVLGPGGKVNEPDKIVWDESKDGPLPSDVKVKVGGFKRQNNELIYDDASFQAQKNAKESARLERENKLNNIKAIQAKLKNKNASLQELNDICLYLLGKYIGE